MRVALFGPVTQAHLQDAELFAAIAPREFVCSGEHPPPTSDLATDVIPLDPMVGEAARRQNNWRLMLHADALVCVGESSCNTHIVNIAIIHGVPVYEVPA